MASYVALAFALLPSVNGHAFMYFPPIRGHDGTEPQSMGTVPQGQVGTGMPTCGKSQWLDATGPITNLQAGQKVVFEVKVTAHHRGHLEFRLCDQKMSSAYGTEDLQDACFRQHVLKRARPEQVHSDCVVNDPRGDCQPYNERYPEYWFLPPAMYNEQVAGENFQDSDAQDVDEYNEHPNLLQEAANSSSKYSAGGLYRMTFWVPSDFSCDTCTLQFWYRTANSATPDPEAYRCYWDTMTAAGWNAGAFMGAGWYPMGEALSSCPAAKNNDVLTRKNNRGEQFKNCADVHVAAAGPTPPPTPMPPTPPPTPAPPTPEPEPASEPATSGGATTGGAASGGAASGGACIDHDISMYAGYENHPCSAWPVSHCPHRAVLRDNCGALCGCGTAGAGTTATTPQTEPEPASEPSSTPSEPEPEPTSEPASTPASTPSANPSVTSSSTPCDNGEGSCKAQCSAACGNSVATNQCWGTPRYIECKCSDGTRHSFAGCECMNSNCPTSLSETMAHVGNVKRHRFLASSGSSMLQEAEEREQQDEVLLEHILPQDEL